jgi:hypothetical protein
MHKKYFLWKKSEKLSPQVGVKEKDLDMSIAAPPDDFCNHMPARAYPGYCPRKDD